MRTLYKKYIIGTYYTIIYAYICIVVITTPGYRARVIQVQNRG